MINPKRHGILNPDREIADMKVARAALVRIITAYEIQGVEYTAAQNGLRALDEMAGLLTGDHRALIRSNAKVPPDG